MWKIEVPTDSILEFDLGDTVVDIQWMREAREREEAHKQRQGRQEHRRYTRKRSELQKKCQEPRKVTQKQRYEERQDHHSHDTRWGTWPSVLTFVGQSKKEMSLREVRQQLQVVCQGVQDLV